MSRAARLYLSLTLAVAIAGALALAAAILARALAPASAGTRRYGSSSELLLSTPPLLARPAFAGRGQARR